jgi:hypothetical protein
VLLHAARQPRIRRGSRSAPPASALPLVDQTGSGRLSRRLSAPMFIKLALPMPELLAISGLVTKPRLTA